MGRIAVVGFVAGLLVAGSLCGCAFQGEPEIATPPAEDQAEQEQVLVIGVESADSAELQATNETGKDIAAVFVKETAAEQYPDEALASDEAWKDGETAQVHYPKAQTAVDEQEGQTVSSLHDVRLVFSDGTSVELFEVPEEGIEDAVVKMEGDVAYLDYEDALTGERATTLERQKAIAEEKRLQAEAEAEAAAKAEAEASEQSETEDAVESGSSASVSSASSSYYYYDSGSGWSSGGWGESAPSGETAQPETPVQETPETDVPSSSDDGQGETQTPEESGGEASSTPEQ